MDDLYHDPLHSLLLSNNDDSSSNKSDTSILLHPAQVHGFGPQDQSSRRQGDGTGGSILADVNINRIIDPGLTQHPNTTKDEINTESADTRPESPTLLAEEQKSNAERHPKQEQPKRVSSTRLWRALVDFLLFQLPSVAITLFLLALYIRKFTWYPDPTQLSGLLFAARVHETLIVASLFQILYYHIRRSLLIPGSLGNREGLSFGLLTSVFQLGSPFYMMSSSFWAPLVKQGPSDISLYSIAFGLLVVVSFTLTALAGASSSVVMLPTQGWYEFQLDDTSLGQRQNATRGVQFNPKRGGYYTRPVPFVRFLVDRLPLLYPSVVDETTIPQECLNTSKYPYNCPFYNWANTDSVAARWQRSNTHLATVMNISVALYHDSVDMDPNEFGVSHQIVTYKDLRRGSLDKDSLSYAIAAATCPQTTTLEMLSNEGMTWPGIELKLPTTSQRPLKLSTKIFDRTGRMVPVKQPRIVIQCAGELEPLSQPHSIGQDTNNSTRWHFDQGFYPAFDLELDDEVLPSYSRGNGSDVSPSSGFIDTKRYFSNTHNNMTVSAAFWMQGYRYMWSSSNFTVCLVDARWVESDVWIMPLDSALLARHTVSVDSPDYSTSPDAPIQLTAEWLNVLHTTSVSLGDSVAFRIDTLCLFIADALSRINLNHGQWAENFDKPGGDGPWEIWDPSHEAHLTNMTLPELRGNSSGENYAMMEVAYYHNACAYEFGTSMVTTLSWVVLLLHLLLVVIHAVVVIFHKGWSSGAWVQLGQLLALAVASKPPRDPILTNTGGGVDTWRTWMLMVSVKEVEDENGMPSGKVELVLQEPGIGTGQRHRTTEEDRKYG